MFLFLIYSSLKDLFKASDKLVFWSIIEKSVFSIEGWNIFLVFQVALILTLSLVGKMCGARTEALPDRDLKTYLPDAVSASTEQLT